MSDRNGTPTQVWFVQGKAANRAFRQAVQTPPSLPHNEAHLSQKGRNIETVDPKHDEPKEAGHDAHHNEH